MRAFIYIVTVIAIAGCEWNSDTARVDASMSRRDGRPPMGDAIEDDAAGPPAGHLLLTEVALQPVGSEFIEITNPTSVPISLADYYLADTGEYWRLPGGTPTINVSDFIVEFPMTATVPAGGSITIATGPAATFMTAFGVPPTYSIAGGTVTRTVVPGTATLTDAGEIIVLFHWDGTAGLVGDVDMMIAGVPTAANGLTSKSGATLGSSTYATDANTITAQTAAPGTGVTTKRTMAETGLETQDGTGNGIDGDDETSENTRMTWDATFTAATPGQAPTL